MKRLSIGQAWDEARSALSAKRRLLVPVALGLVMLPALVAAMVEPPAAAGQQPAPGPWLLVVLAMVLVMMAAQLVLVLLVNGWTGSVGQAIGQATRRLPVLIAAALLLAIPAVFLLAFLLAIIALATGGDGQMAAATINGPGRLAIALAIVVLLFVGVRLLPLTAVVAERRDGPIAALRRSFAMTAGQFWRLLAFLLMAAIALMVLLVASAAVVGALATLLLGPPEPWTVSLLLIALAGAAVQAGFVLVYSAMLARIAAQLDPDPA